jgi:hypothetical protein
MKKLQLLFIAFLLTGAVIAQVPNAINYQAVARNNAGAALATQTIKVRLGIVRNAVSLYSETRQVTTNALGLFNVQIGSAGALATTGSFTGIDWQNNPAPLMLKVELDISNTNVFTDMGSQSFATVPYSFAAKEADEAANAAKIGGNAVAVATPNSNDLLKWNGTAWIPVAGPQLYPVATAGISIPAAGSASPAWTAGFNNAPTVTLTAGQKIAVSFTSSFQHINSTAGYNYFSVDVCYQAIGGGTIYNIGANQYSDGELPPGNKTQLIGASAGASVVAGASLGTQNVIPPGTYKVFLGFKNRTDIGGSIMSVKYVNGFIQVL